MLTRKSAAAWKWTILVLALAILALRIGAELTGRGRDYWHIDVRGMFWELSVFYRHLYPHAAVSPPPPGLPHVHSDYPPYAYWFLAFLVPPGLGLAAAEKWFLVAEMVGLTALFGFAWNVGSARGRSTAVLLAVSVLAITGLRADLLFGNVALPEMLLLLGLFFAAARGRWWLAAFIWAAAMTKPQMGWAFALLFVERSCWKQLVTASMSILLLALATCVWTGVSLWSALHVGTSDRWMAIAHVSERYSLVTLLISAGVPVRAAIIGCAVIGSAVLVAILATRLRSTELLRTFAFVATVGRVFAYHNVCDDLLLAFPLIWLGREASSHNDLADWLCFVGLAISVWLPTTVMTLAPMRVLAVGSWIAVAGWIAFRKRLAVKPDSETRYAETPEHA